MLKLYFPSASPYRAYSSQSHCLLQAGCPGLFFQHSNIDTIEGWSMLRGITKGIIQLFEHRSVLLSVMLWVTCLVCRPWARRVQVSSGTPVSTCHC